MQAERRPRDNLEKMMPAFTDVPRILYLLSTRQKDNG